MWMKANTETKKWYTKTEFVKSQRMGRLCKRKYGQRIGNHEEQKHAFKRAAEDVHAVAADHDDLTVGNEYLDVYDGSKSRTYDDGIRHYLCNNRWIVIFLQPLSYSGRFDPVLNTVQGNPEHAVKGTYRSLCDHSGGWTYFMEERPFFGNRGWKRKVYPEDNPGIEQGNFSEG